MWHRIQQYRQNVQITIELYKTAWKARAVCYIEQITTTNLLQVVPISSANTCNVVCTILQDFRLVPVPTPEVDFYSSHIPNDVVQQWRFH